MPFSFEYFIALDNIFDTAMENVSPSTIIVHGSIFCFIFKFLLFISISLVYIKSCSKESICIGIGWYLCWSCSKRLNLIHLHYVLMLM